MAEELIRVDRAGANGTPAGGARAARGTFPAGTGLTLMALSFVLTRVILRYTLSHPTAASLAVLTGVAGAVLACAAIAQECLAAVRTPRGGFARAMAYLRAAAVVPLFALVIAAMVGEPPAGLQWVALVGVGVTLAASGLAGISAARGQWFARVALGTLVVGEVIELGWPAAAVAAAPESFFPRAFERLAPLSEIAALVGSLAAALWAVSATRRSAGESRTRAFAGLPLAGAAMISLRVAMAPVRPSVSVARILFGSRFDLVQDSAHLTTVSIGVVLLYLLIPELLLVASCVSAAALSMDRGAAGRRVAGWMAVLLAGFGTLRLAGPMDPIRMVMVTLAAVMLERAATLEAEDRAGG